MTPDHVRSYVKMRLKMYAAEPEKTIYLILALGYVEAYGNLSSADYEFYQEETPEVQIKFLEGYIK